MKQGMTSNCVYEPMDLDCLILNPAFINRRPASGVYKKQMPSSCRRTDKKEEKNGDDSAIMKFVVAAVAVFALALFI